MVLRLDMLILNKPGVLKTAVKDGFPILSDLHKFNKEWIWNFFVKHIQLFTLRQITIKRYDMSCLIQHHIIYIYFFNYNFNCSCR